MTHGLFSWFLSHATCVHISFKSFFDRHLISSSSFLFKCKAKYLFRLSPTFILISHLASFPIATTKRKQFLPFSVRKWGGSNLKIGLDDSWTLLQLDNGCSAWTHTYDTLRTLCNSAECFPFLACTLVSRIDHFIWDYDERSQLLGSITRLETSGNDPISSARTLEQTV